MRQSLLKKAPRLILLCGLATGLLAGCIGEDNPQPPPPAIETPIATATAANSNPAQPTPATTLPSPVPMLVLSANNSRDAEMFQGWPVMFEVSLMHPDYLRADVLAQPLIVGVDGSPWSSAVTLEVVDAEGKAQSWPLQMAGALDGAITLDNEATGTVYLWLDPAESARLKEGVYAVTASLDTASLSGGWKGTAESIPAILTVSKAPTKLSPEQESMRAQMLASQAIVRGDRAGAMSHLDELLAAQPGNISALEFKGDLLAEEGKTSEALDAYSKAIKTFYEQNETPDEAPTILAQKQHAMMDKLINE
ncbi:MAG: hypothetical protein WCD37_02610 [Chloroflexia bacterium]